MKLLYDLLITQPTSSNKRNGGGIYGEILFRRIVERQLPITCFYSSKRSLNKDVVDLIKKNSIACYDVEERPLSQIVLEEKITKIYSALPYDVRTFTGCEVVGTVHGLRQLELPLDKFFFRYKNSWESFKSVIKFVAKYIPCIGYEHEKRIIKDYINNSKFSIITVSNHSAYSFRVFFPESKNKDIKTFYSPSTITETIETRKYNFKYFLLVSANRWEKNCLRALMALDKLFSNGLLDDYKVIITGAHAKEKSFFYKIANSDRFEMKDYVDDHELQQLYHDAYCFIYPSLNEGFGYPPIEAMHYGIPVIASSFTSIYEVCGDAVLYVNPFSVEEIMNRVLMVKNPTVYDEMVKKSKERFRFITKKQNDDLEQLIDFLYVSDHSNSDTK